MCARNRPPGSRAATANTIGAPLSRASRAGPSGNTVSRPKNVTGTPPPRSTPASITKATISLRRSARSSEIPARSTGSNVIPIAARQATAQSITNCGCSCSVTAVILYPRSTATAAADFRAPHVRAHEDDAATELLGRFEMLLALDLEAVEHRARIPTLHMKHLGNVEREMAKTSAGRALDYGVVRVAAENVRVIPEGGLARPSPISIGEIAPRERDATHKCKRDERGSGAVEDIPPRTREPATSVIWTLCSPHATSVSG